MSFLRFCKKGPLGRVAKALLQLLQRRVAAHSGIHWQADLDAAIRRGDAEAVEHALTRGATLACCTLDHEGFHTPIELAESAGNATVNEVLQAHRDSAPFRI